MLFVWQEFLRWCLGHSFGIIGGGADGRGEGVLFVIVFGYVVWCDEDGG
jgi:hypothetical protein